MDDLPLFESPPTGLGLSAVGLWSAAAGRQEPGPRPGSILEKAKLHGCTSCHVGSSKVLLFINERKDGAGARAESLIYALALAARLNFSFGGVFLNPVEGSTWSHGVQPVEILRAALGLDTPSDLFFDAYDAADLYDVRRLTFKSVEKLEAAYPQGASRRCADTAIILFATCIACEVDNGLRSRTVSYLDEYMTPTFLDALRRGSKLATLMERPAFSDGRVSVALHLRRGDVNGESERFANRWVPDEWFLGVVDHIQARFPSADIHAFTSSEGHAVNLTAFERRGIVTHVDNDPSNDWAHFASAHILVTTKSSFSHVPALFNPNCVIYKSFWHHPLSRWTDGDWLLDGTPGDGSLDRCISQLPGEFASQALAPEQGRRSAADAPGTGKTSAERESRPH